MATKRNSSSSRSSGKTQSISSRGGSRGSSNRGSSNRGGGNRSSGGEGKIDNVTYDIITVLHKKSKGLEAYDKYLQDVEGRDEIRELLEEIREQDQEHVQRLEQCLREIFLSEEGQQEEAA
jgi:hypothetical protein